MVFYEYQHGDTYFSKKFSIGKAPAKTKCPHCGKLGKRVYSLVSVTNTLGGLSSPKNERKYCDA